jgi:SP family facilitated glucose transporter-like MFS transporter 1
MRSHAQSVKGEDTSLLKDNGKDRVTLLLVTAAVFAVFGSLAQFGYQSGVINTPMDVIIGVYKNTTCSLPYPSHSPCSKGQSLYAIAVAMNAVGGLIGAFLSGKTADTLGRKPTLLLNNFLAIGGSLMMAFSSSFSLLIAGRFIMGVNGGFNTSVASIYLSEIAPVRLRGVFVTLAQLGIAICIFLSQLFGLPELLGNKDLWRLLFGFPVVFATILLLTLPFCPESPRYLFIEKHQEIKAANVLRVLRGSNSIETELDELKLELKKKSSAPKVSYMQLFCDNTLRKPLIISFGLHFAQQLTGVIAVHPHCFVCGSVLENWFLCIRFVSMICNAYLDQYIVYRTSLVDEWGT